MDDGILAAPLVRAKCSRGGYDDGNQPSTKGETMGYEIHITRKMEWFDKGGPNISLEDWKAYISSDPDMRLDGYAEVIM